MQHISATGSSKANVLRKDNWKYLDALCGFFLPSISTSTPVSIVTGILKNYPDLYSPYIREILFAMKVLVNITLQFQQIELAHVAYCHDSHHSRGNRVRDNQV